PASRPNPTFSRMRVSPYPASTWFRRTSEFGRRCGSGNSMRNERSAHRFGAREFRQALHARLRLLRLAGLRLESIDERLQVRAFGLFLLEGDLLLAQLLRA